MEVRARELVSGWLADALRASDRAAAELAAGARDGGGVEPGLASPALLRGLAARLLRRERPVLELEAHNSEEFCAAGRAALAAGRAALRDFEADRWDDESGWCSVTLSGPEGSLSSLLLLQRDPSSSSFQRIPPPPPQGSNRLLLLLLSVLLFPLAGSLAFFRIT